MVILTCKEERKRPLITVYSIMCLWKIFWVDGGIHEAKNYNFTASSLVYLRFV